MGYRMILTLSLSSLLLVTTSLSAQETKPPGTRAGSSIDAELAQKLLKVKRIYVDSFGEDAISKQIQAMVISSLSASKKFIITENKDKADAILRGRGIEKTSQELHAFGEGTAVGAVGASQTGLVGRAAAIDDTSASTETINDARLAVRLVSTDGDVIWSTTQESRGAKYKGASADVADKIAKQLLHDLEKLEKLSVDATAPGPEREKK